MSGAIEEGPSMLGCVVLGLRGTTDGFGASLFLRLQGGVVGGKRLWVI